jgi:hypothetical protein
MPSAKRLPSACSVSGCVGGSPANLADQLEALGKECAALPDYDTRSPEEIIGYEENGMLT